MIHDVFSAAGHSVWAGVMLVVLILVFGGVIYWTYSGGRHRFDDISRLPLDENEKSRIASDARRIQP